MTSPSIAAGGQAADLVPITIEVGSANSKSYKSIKHLIWRDIPSFVVLTGLNGSGKTQLLEILAYRMTGTVNTSYPDLNAIEVKVTGDNTITPESVAYLPSNWDITGHAVLGIAQLQELKSQLYDQLGARN